MKKTLIFSILIFLSIQTFAQITSEHIYNNTGWCKGGKTEGGQWSTGIDQFYLIHLEIDGDKYVKIDKMAQKMDFYDLNHTFWKSINYSGVSISPLIGAYKSQCSILYISQNLFNTDAKIEFMYAYASYNGRDSIWDASTQIVNEDGTVLFSHAGAALVAPSFPSQYYPIYNTSKGTKMILSNVNGTAEVFSLAGTLATGVSENKIMKKEAEMSLFPNPSMGENMITINYMLPEENNTANLFVYDTQGKQVKAYKIGKDMSNILVNASEFSSGIYYYSIITDAGKIIASKKSIIIE